MENKDRIEIPFGAKDSELCECEYTIPEGYEAEIKDGKVIIKKKESEDERIRKELIAAFQNGVTYNQISKARAKDYIAWLEKQKSTHNSNQKFKVKDKVKHKETGKVWTIHWYLSDTNSYYVIDEEGLIHHYNEDVLESIEWKPVEWSEEDERKLNTLIGYIISKNELGLEYAGWLKSLKYRIQPQPEQDWSEEEIENCAREAEDNNCIILAKHIRQLKSLRPQNQWGYNP